MQVTLRVVPVEEKEILRNLLEKYNYEFSQYDGCRVNRLGLFGYDWLDCYWTEPNRWAYFILADGALAGFAMVNDYPEAGRKTDFSMSEFFVMYPFRRAGVGKAAAQALFRAHTGSWQLKYHPKNVISVRFWNAVVADFTAGSYERIDSVPEAAYDDGTPASMLYFAT